MDFSTLTKTDFAALHCFSKSKSICADASAKSRAIHAIWTPQNGGKRGGCVLSKAKLLILFRIDAILRKKSFKTIEKRKHRSKTSGLSFELSLFFAQTTLLFGKSRYSAAFPPRPSLSHAHRHARTDTRHAHRALSKFAFLAFTLHLHPQCVENGKDTRELSGDFNTSPVKKNAPLPSPVRFCPSEVCAFWVKR